MSDHADRMYKTLERLFAEAPKLEDGSGKPVPGQAPALQCVIILRSGGNTEGVLSTTAEGALRMMSPLPYVPGQGARSTAMMEQFFDYEDVMVVAIKREVQAAPGSRLVTS